MSTSASIRWKPQISLRSLLLITLLFAISISVWQARSARLRRELERARTERDVALREWKQVFEEVVNGIGSANDAQIARDKYFAARKRLERIERISW